MYQFRINGKSRLGGTFILAEMNNEYTYPCLTPLKSAATPSHSAIAAAGRTNRIELCENLAQGGNAQRRQDQTGTKPGSTSPCLS